MGDYRHNYCPMSFGKATDPTRWGSSLEVCTIDCAWWENGCVMTRIANALETLAQTARDKQEMELKAKAPL